MALITCPECSKEISSLATACPNCGCPINVQQTIAKTRQADEPEIVLMQGLCNRIKKSFGPAALTENGSAILTNHRLIYLKHSPAKILAIGVLTLLTKGDFEFDIPLNQITDIEEKQQGLNKIIIINTKSNENYSFFFTKREEWKIKIESARKAY